MQVAVTGGTGFVGQDVVEVLLERGDRVIIVTRDPSRVPVQFHGHVEAVTWDGLDLARCDGVVHLAGESLLARRWSPAQKEAIRASRIEGTRRVVAAIGRATPRPRVLVSASAIGYYGPHEEGELDETSPAGDDYLASVCRDWEAAAASAREHGCRVVPLRIGVVLDEGGGALARLLRPFRLFLGGRVGSGRQWVSWVHRRDVARLVAFALDDEKLDEPLNATSPGPVRMAELARVLGKVLGRPAWLPAPSLAVRLALGEAAGTVLQGQKVLPTRALACGFQFAHPELRKALEEILTEEVVP